MKRHYDQSNSEKKAFHQGLLRFGGRSTAASRQVSKPGIGAVAESSHAETAVRGRERRERARKRERGRDKWGGDLRTAWAFETSKYTPSDLHPTRSHLLILKKQFYQLGPNIQTYKLTESVLILTTSTKGELQDHPSTL